MSPHDLGRIPGDPSIHQAVAADNSNIIQSRANASEVHRALKQTEQEGAQAEQAYAEAWAKGDGLAVAKATRLIQDIEHRRHTLQAGLDELVPQAQRLTTDEMLARMPHLREDEKEWLRQHPDALAVPDNQARLRIAFNDAQRKGIERGSEEYFAHMNDRLGYGQPKQPETWAAPRGNGSGNDNGGGQPRLKEGQVRLSPQQREHAKASGVSEEEYARGVQQLNAFKKQGMYGATETA